MKRILVTGGAGFIGSNLVNKLYNLNYTITVLDNLSEQVHGIDPSKSPLFLSVIDKAKLIVGSVSERKTLENALEDQDAVVHLAAETGTGQSMYMVDHYTNINIQSTALLLDILGNSSDISVKRLIVASSRSIYGEGKYRNSQGNIIYPGHRREKDLKEGLFDLVDQESGTTLELLPTDENSAIHPSSVYGITKQVQEQLVMTVCPTIGIDPVALRFQNVFGPGQSLSNPYTGILSIFSNLMMKHEKINIFEDGLESRDFVYIDDAINAIILSIESDSARGQVFNVGSGIATSVIEVFEELRLRINKDAKYFVSGDYRLGDIRHNCADLEKIKRILGYTPNTKFSEGIEKFAEWAISEGPKESKYSKSLEEMKQRGLMAGPGN